MTDLRRGRGLGAAPAILAGVCAEDHHSDVFLLTCGDVGLAELARRQHGVVSRPQLRALGLERGAVERRLLSRRLQPLHRGVYAVGHTRVSYRGRLWAAILACGGTDAAVLSHRSAAAVWELIPTPAGNIEVTTLRAAHSMPAVRVHRSSTLDPARYVIEHDGLPVTTVARTLEDLAPTLTPHRLERICHRAAHLHILDAAVLTDTHGKLRQALRTLAAGDPQITRSELEERFLELIAGANLPRPEVNTRIEGYEVDFAWRAHRLIAETDGIATHLTPTAFEEDRRRDAQLQTAGYRVLRFTWRQVTQRPRETAAALGSVLS